MINVLISLKFAFGFTFPKYFNNKTLEKNYNKNEKRTTPQTLE